MTGHSTAGKTICYGCFLPAVFLFSLLLSACGNTGGRKEEFPFRERAEEIMARRAGTYAPQKHLVVDFYRIYEKLAYPLPVTEIHYPSFYVERIQGYPWEIWLTWELEQRINSLGWAGQWLDNPVYRKLAQADLAALAGWPEFDTDNSPHLAGAHAMRMMTSAVRHWPWLDPDLKERIKAACARMVDINAAWLERRLGLTTPEQILESPSRGSLTHNIPAIATLGMCMAARLSGHSLAGALESHSLALILAELDLRARDYTEAVGYDGYILDFVADWLEGASPGARDSVLRHPALEVMLGQSAILAAPGAVMRVAPLNDVEPLQMPYHADAHAKLARLRPDPLSAWYLARCELDWLRSDALAALHDLELQGAPQAPPAGAGEGLYAMTLRSGWENEDLAAVMAASNVPPGHMQVCNGSIVIGTQGRWLIDDPGYQQYMAGLEREFTLGPDAHNYPLVNGQPQKIQSVRRLACATLEKGLLYAALEITGGYDKSLNLSSVVRHLWMLGDSLIVVADRVVGPDVRSCRYTWQANPEAALWLERGACLIHLGQADLWVQCAGSALEGSRIRRLPGTRGQVSIQAELETGSDSCIWWLFNLGDNPAAYQMSGDRLKLEAAGHSFSVETPG